MLINGNNILRPYQAGGEYNLKLSKQKCNQLTTMSNAKVTLTRPVFMYLRILLPWVAVSSLGVVEGGPYYSSCNCCSSWTALLLQNTRCIKCSACYSLDKIRLQGNWPSQDWTKLLPACQQYRRHTTVSNVCNFTLYHSFGRLHIYCCLQQKSCITYKKMVFLSISPFTQKEDHAKSCAEAVMKIVGQKQGRQRESPCYDCVMLHSSV